MLMQMDSKNKFDIEKFKHLGKYMNYELDMPNFKEINGIIYKLCTKCKKYKPMTDEYFYKRSNVKCGYNSTCKDCEKEKGKSRIRVPSFNDKGELYCHTCKTYKPVSEFYTGSGIKCRENYSLECKECESKRKKIAWASKQKGNKEFFLKHLLYGCKTRALREKLPYNLDAEFIAQLYNEQNEKCALSNLKMSTTVQSGKNPYNVSIDRIVPELGYVKGNVRLVCSHVNMMRSNLEDEQLIEFCKAIINYAESK